MSALRRRGEEAVEDDVGMAVEERAPKIWKTATVAVLLFLTGSVRAQPDTPPFPSQGPLARTSRLP
jgi:hypothetical protein